MNENNLLASVALFSELYNTDNNISNILSEFIKAAVYSENKLTINSTELTKLLEKVYQFKIPESVVRTTVKNRLRGIVDISNGFYNFDSNISKDYEKLKAEYDNKIQTQGEIIKSLVAFIGQKVNNPITANDEHEIIENFNHYLMDNGVSDKYSKLISAFVIKNQLIPGFKETLNLIREGIILYQGIKFTADINELGQWNTDLVIFLSTEHLFNSLGYNGVLYEEIFNDFYKLVTEINISGRNKYGEKRIELKYLEETKSEIDAFFQTAESIKRGHIVLDTSKPAMKTIVDSCADISDVSAKKIQFYADLKQKGINLQEFNQPLHRYAEYNVYDRTVLEEIKLETEAKGRRFDERLCEGYFNIFTKINYYRGGESKTNFERIGHIFITGNRFALYLARHNKVKFADYDIPFAQDIDYITNKFWFKLKKGFSDKQYLPKSFDVVTKAQLVLSSQLNQSISQKYFKLQEEFKSGLLTRDQAIERSYELREKPNKPEEITIDNLDNSLEFLNNDTYFEDLYREKVKKEEIHAETLRRNEELQKELDKRVVEEKRIEAIKQQEIFDRSMTQYISEIWRDCLKAKKKDVVYMLGVVLITSLPFIIAIALKVIDKLSTWFDSFGNWKYFFYFLLVIIPTIELLGRSYFFNKERMKNGGIWFVAFFVRSKRRQIISEFKLEHEIEYKNNYNK